MIRALVDEHDNDIFIVGDARQRIYGRTVVLSECGIKIQGRARRLRINYRTTEEIRDTADRIFQTSGKEVADSVFDAVRNAIPDGAQTTTFDDLNGGNIELGDSRSLVNGPEPIAHRFASHDDEEEAVRRWIFELCGELWMSGVNDDDSTVANKVDPRNVCVVARTGPLVAHWKSVLDDGLPYGVYRLGPGEDDRQKAGIRVTTMHRVKGLEFDYMIVVDVNDGVCPPAAALQSVTGDSVAERELCKQERSLIYVALTRARKAVLVTGVGDEVL